MKPAYNVAVLVGSLRRNSISRKMANAVGILAPKSLQLKVVEIAALPLYNEDLEFPALDEAYRSFRHQIKAADALLFVTPEYNRSVPGPLKNAIDVGSAPHGQNVFRGKPGAIISLSPGAMGAFGANHHLRQSLVFLDVPTLQQPEAYIGGSDALFDSEGRFVNATTSDYLKGFMRAFAAWIGKHSIEHHEDT